MGVLQPWHLIVIVVIVLVIFGPGKLPLLGKAIGDGLRDFKKATRDEPEPPTLTSASTSTTTTVATLAPATRACPSCQRPVLARDRFCGGCGARTDSAAA